MRVLNNSDGDANGDVKLDKLDCYLLMQAVYHYSGDQPPGTFREHERLCNILDQLRHISHKLNT